MFSSPNYYRDLPNDCVPILSEWVTNAKIDLAFHPSTLLGRSLMFNDHRLRFLLRRGVGRLNVRRKVSLAALLADRATRTQTRISRTPNFQP